MVAAIQTVPFPDLKPLEILLAEDNDVNELIARRVLEHRGHTVTSAHDGIEALAQFDRRSFDLVLMDVQMPGMDGLEATAQIRLREKVTHGHQYIIAMTAHAMVGDRERCLAAGMDGYLTKPLNTRDLDMALAAVVPGTVPARA